MNKVLDKNSKKADALANLYRAALYLGRGAKETGIDFLEKAEKEIKESEVRLLLTESQKNLETPQQQRYWAEKILDQYHKLRLSLT